ncbi:MAG: methylenetetrahydrofolate--tRNA-(uracil(54)-C(5))-methyltransferase (FADH(2)-oxidizing) TrmFO [Proteobacteria bacterium]|nr:methylenetetrahydrofolate--tRNA-(uracil(54)-C(5))-methyltransferase (FADH(2)-oxidizing) TrmFO [Pseudomonadota bacterium]MBU1742935.1 methylenetetrahydrofolate--tRNA-(uracil(54)-C(5))-methyltransferase (FADH(2)-oxidizing) TrmFO [Pseudomonadota bacterium]
MMAELLIIGGGLAGCEAAWAAARAGLAVELWEMRPARQTPAHETGLLAELVCSNSLRAAKITSAVGLLKDEMARLGSIVIEAARETRVPAGGAWAVDRMEFAGLITAWIQEHPRVEVVTREADRIPEARPLILATGPLTSEALAADLARLTGRDRLFFYDAIAPIIDAQSIDRSIAFEASRYEDGPGDYLNLPLTENEYNAFYDALMAADTVKRRDFESTKHFEGCLPIEVMARRGRQTLAFGPMKPVGLIDPRTNRRPFAVVQLRREDAHGTAFNMVGFQTRLTHAAQSQVFRTIPGLAGAEFPRLGSIHRNTFLEAPAVLTPALELRENPGLYVAGQLSGVEGYVESAAMGILAGLNAARRVREIPPVVPPVTTALGALITHLTTPIKNFQPSNVNFGLFPPLAKKTPKKMRGQAYADRAQKDLEAWMAENDLHPEAGDGQ